MLIKCIKVSVRPMASGAKPMGARLSVAPRMTNRENRRHDDFAYEARRHIVVAGRMIAEAVGRKSAGQGIRAVSARDEQQHSRCRDAAQDLHDPIRKYFLRRMASADHPAPG